MNRIDAHERRTAVDTFEILHRQLHMVEVTEELVRTAGGMAEEFGLRATTPCISLQCGRSPTTMWCSLRGTWVF